MKRIKTIGLMVLALQLGQAELTAAQTGQTGSAAAGLMQQAQAAINTEEYVRAVQILTRIVAMPENAYSAPALELLGNVREANGQLAHAVAEYETYLTKYPRTDGAARVQQRLNALVSGAAPLAPNPPDTSAPAVAEDGAQTSAPAAQPVAPRAAPAAPATAAQVAAKADEASTGTRVRSRGAVTLTYRYNEGATEITDLTPDPDDAVEEEDTFENALVAGLNYQRIIDQGDQRITLSFSGLLEFDFESEDTDTDLRLSEALVAFEDRTTGRVITVGRQRVEPRGIAYRTDGVSLRWPAGTGVALSVVAGAVVESSRDDFLSGDRYLLGGGAEFEEAALGGDIAVYAAMERDGSLTYRNVIGVEFDRSVEQNALYVNLEYDTHFQEISRFLVTGTTVLDNAARVTGRLSYYRNPSLNLENALIGQDAETIDELITLLGEDSVTALALDRSAEVTTLGLTYYGKLSESWDLSLDGTLYQNSGTPATTDGTPVDAVPDAGVQGYYGVRFTGESIFRPDDRLNLGLRYADNTDSDLIVADGSLRIPLSPDMYLTPRLRVGQQDFDDGSDEVFAIPSVSFRYKVNPATTLQVDAGGRWSRNEAESTTTRQHEFYIVAGVSRSF